MAKLKIVVFVTTVGEPSTFEVIRSFVDNTPVPFKLVAWYDACGRGVDRHFYDKLLLQCDDVILSTQQKGLAAVMGFAALYLDYDYLIWTMADTPVYPDYFARISEALNEVPTAGAVGEAWRPMVEKYAVSDFDRGIDGVVCLKREAVEAAGSFSPSFNGKGPFHQELYRRMTRCGFDFVAIDGLCANGALTHEGRDADKNWHGLLHEDNLAWREINKADYKYKWWTKEMGKKELASAKA